jgi:formylmethanofuran dehydrogenase subunit C
VLSLPHLASLSTTLLFGDSATQIQAEAGGKVDLPALNQATGGSIQLLAEGAGSQLNVPLLANLSSQSQQPSGLTVSGGVIQDPLLTTLDNANVSLDGTGTVSTSQITRLTGGTLSVAGGTPDFSGLADIDDTNIMVSGGASLSLPGIASFQGGANTQSHTSTLQATGAGSVLSLPHLVALSTSTQFGDSVTQIQAEGGGKLDLPALSQISGGSSQLLAQGVGSDLNLPLLASLDSQSQPSSLTVSGGAIQDPLLTSLVNTNLSLDGTGTISTSQITQLTGGTLTVAGGTPDFSGLADIDNTSVLVSGGASVSLPGVTSYQGGTNAQTHTSTLQATGAGSALSLPHLVALSTGTQFGDSVTQIQAAAGGKLDLPALSQVSGGSTQLHSQDLGSQLNVPVLTSITSQAQPASLTLNGGTIQDPQLTTLVNTNLSLDGTGTMSSSQITHLTGGTLSVAGGNPNFSGLTDLDTSNVLVSGGATVTLPSVTSYQGGANAQSHTSTLQASGAGSLLSLPHLATVDTSTTFGDSVTQVQAESSGKIDLPVFTQTSGGSTQLVSQGAGSQLNVPSLTSLSSQAQPSGLTVNGGLLNDPLLTSLDNVSLSLDGTGTLSTSQFTHITGSTLTITAGTPNFSGLTDIDSTSVLVSGGATVSLPGVTSYHGGAGPQLHTSTLQARFRCRNWPCSSPARLLAIRLPTSKPKQAGGSTCRC